ncbi:restriction endonuclease S subunit [Synechococcus sp. PCC 7502]|uniref:restriction endonuclease subunit S n=1 Tax=Synechococcus sp. PCC 7502 TaxID=1173263 RepID=UPI00029F9F20|nr:restriction endonuclease subunit S [Synechococcus sp. PCC 7502]AFY73476.1 restriction endonuclease S subunit [Synechococcus sp. PCC 7502]
MKVSETKTIEEITEVLIDYRGKTPPKTNEGIKLITAKVIKDGRISDGNHEYISEETYSTYMKRGFPKQGDILITTEAPLGEVAQLKTAERIALAQRVILLRGNPKKIDQRYYFQAVKSDFVKAELNARSTGTTVLGIKQAELRKVRIPYYPLPTQRKIASILSGYDDLIENNTRRIKILEEMAQMLYREWFVNFRFPNHENVKMVESELGLIPEGWEVKPITEAIFVNPKTQVPKEGIKPFVPMGCLSNDSMLINDIESRTGNSGSKFKNSDTLFARITPCLENGKTGFVQFLESIDSVAFGSTEFIVLRSKTLCPEYVYLLSRSDSFRDNAIKSMSGATGRQRVREICFNSFMFAHPTQEIIQYFSTLVAPYFSLIYNLNQRNINLQKTRDLLLPKLISGEIDVEKLDIETLEMAA